MRSRTLSLHTSGSRSALIRAVLFESISEPTRLVLLIALFQFAIWGILSGHLAVVPPDDSLEQILLSQEFRLAYGKHPPLPTWILFAWSQTFGASIGATYVLGASCAIATMLLLYAFARPLVGERRAALAAILLSNIEYLNAGTAYFNHNTVQLPLALLAIALFYRALTRMRWFDWALFGAGCGLMMLAKFSAVVLFASFGVYLLWTRRWTEPSVWKGIGIALILFGLVIAPYLLAVRGDEWDPNTYARNSVFPVGADRIQCLKTVWGFASSQAAKVAPALLIFAILRRGAFRAGPTGGQVVALGPFLTMVGFGPLVLTVVVAAATGAHLLVGWGTTFHVLLTLWLVAANPFGIDVQPSVLRRAALLTAGAQIALWALVVTHDGRLPNLNPTRHPASPPTPGQLAEAVRSVWAQHCVAPLRFVLTDRHTGAALAVGFQGHPRVVDATQGELKRFFSDEARLADGAVAVLRSSESATALGASQLPIDKLTVDTHWRETVELSSVDGRRFKYDLSILPPVAGRACK